ncbi:Phospholipase_D-nuclease N-terminal [Bryocella elongata]|uniref:Phospholipase_D-nuclease N-terminal n=1 Tax=Bryocella elongata TaxID=863522 RepID=A0A1H6BR18_9BACT|nr:Phospholipase_D-nuclease N-terminal [Bryocella elongata]
MNGWLSGRQDNGANFGDDELRMIPRWAMVGAVLVFAAMQWVFHVVMPHHKHEVLALRLMMSYTWGALWASYVLLIGYVSRDTQRRGMSPALWMLVCMILPGGIGAVVYFLLRQPELSRCPNCATSIASSYNFCPQCQFQTAPVCGICHRGVRITDVYCTQCGHDLASDGAPQRLRVYSDGD